MYISMLSKAPQTVPSFTATMSCLQRFQTADKYETAELRNAACIHYTVSFSLQWTRRVLLFKTFPLVSHPEVTTAVTWHSQSQLPELL